jgi:hypothetical protein
LGGIIRIDQEIFMSDDLTRLIVGAGGVSLQCDPQELARLNAAPMVEESLDSVSAYGYRLLLTGYSDMIARNERGSAFGAVRQLNGL